jgi:pimeloyl-ACP methyl ester carboxylesterase
MELAVITGTGVPGKLIADLAYLSFRLSMLGHCHVIPIPKWGRGDLDASYCRIEQQLYDLAERYGNLAVLGHSQGGFYSIEAGLKNPDFVRYAMALSTPFNGIRQVTPLFKGPLHWLAPALSDLVFPSQAVSDLRAEVRRNWPLEVAMRLMVAGGDILVRARRSALNLQPRLGTDLVKQYFGRRRPAALPADVEFVHCWLQGHLSEILDPRLLLEVWRNCRHPAAVQSAA